MNSLFDQLLKKIFSKSSLFRKRQSLYLKKNNVSYGENVHFLDGFSISNPYSLPVTIGNDCVINCRIDYESNEGCITIGNNSFVGSQLICRNNIEIGNDVMIAWGGVIYDHNSHSLDWRNRQKDNQNLVQALNDSKSFYSGKDWSTVKSKPIKICDKAWLGFGVTVLNGVTIGEGAVIGAQSVVREDIPPYAIAYGNPAKVVKYIDEKLR